MKNNILITRDFKKNLYPLLVTSFIDTSMTLSLNL